MKLPSWIAALWWRRLSWLPWQPCSACRTMFRRASGWCVLEAVDNAGRTVTLGWCGECPLVLTTEDGQQLSESEPWYVPMPRPAPQEPKP